MNIFNAQMGGRGNMELGRSVMTIVVAISILSGCTAPPDKVDPAVLEALETGDFRYLDLSGLNLANTNFDGTNWTNANASGSDLSGSDFGIVDFTYADLSEANMNEGFFLGANFKERKIRFVDAFG